MKDDKRGKLNYGVAGAVLTGMVILAGILWGIFGGENASRPEGAMETAGESQATISESLVPEEQGAEHASASPEENVSNNYAQLPTFSISDAEVLNVEEDFSLEQYYITERVVATNSYYIDDEGVLWGTGSNEYGQLATGSYGIEEYYEEPVKIAEDVILADASWNGYFCIFLTEAGQLYGVGLNYAGLLLGEGSEDMVYSANEYQKVTEPVLLMENVTYARAGRECIVALKEDKTAYWWGQYAPLTHSHAYPNVMEYYWSLEAQNDNPIKMYAPEPVQIMENCSYITTGTFTGAAISENGELYTWGLNIFGECGTAVEEDDFVRSPVMVLEDVRMVWVETVSFNDDVHSDSDFVHTDFSYPFNTFVLQNDNTLLAAGENIGHRERLTEINGDMVETRMHVFSDSFLPVNLVEYSEEQNREVLSYLSFGMTREEVEALLAEADLEYFSVQEGENFYFCIEDSRYYCYFEEAWYLNEILIQEGGSRDNRFGIGMSLMELEALVEAEGGFLEPVEDETVERYIYGDETQQIQYEFYIYEGFISVLWERKM